MVNYPSFIQSPHSLYDIDTFMGDGSLLDIEQRYISYTTNKFIDGYGLVRNMQGLGYFRVFLLELEHMGVSQAEIDRIREDMNKISSGDETTEYLVR